MRIDGKKLAESIKNELKEKRALLARAPRMLLVYAGESPVIDSYISIKEKTAEELGVELSIQRFPSDVSKDKILNAIARADDDGIVVQLPLPSSIDREMVVNSIPIKKDIDVLSDHAFTLFARGESEIIPPVAGAVEEVLKSVLYETRGKRVAILGKGKLVGMPVEKLLALKGVVVDIFQIGDDLSRLQDYDLIVSGTGQPWLITPDMVKQGAILIDAGTSVEAGVARGDIHPDCESKAAYFSGVPGGIGPITVSVLFRNLFRSIQ